MKNDHPETIIYVDTDRVWCMGEQMDHPKVYYTVPEEGFVVCGYCDIKFMSCLLYTSPSPRD